MKFAVLRAARAASGGALAMRDRRASTCRLHDRLASAAGASALGG
jgi:hypothetical protein